VDAKLTSDKFEPGTDRYGVRTYRLVYRTIDAQGHPATASGLLALPQNSAASLRTVSFAHGTENYKPDAPSTSDDGFLTDPAITYASAGFAAVAPDYLGLGLGPGMHPWMDVPSETTASLDMLRAAREFVARTGRTLRPDVLAAGFSQGASAALGLARALQGGADPWFRLRAVAPISGAYDFLGAELPALLNGDLNAKLTVAYTAYLLVAYDRLHHLYDSPGEVFAQPYAGLVDGLFDGSTPGLDMLGALPDKLDDLLTDRGLSMLEHPSGELAAALRVADSVCVDWAPQVPVRLYFSHDDEEAARQHRALPGRVERARCRGAGRRPRRRPRLQRFRPRGLRRAGHRGVRPLVRPPVLTRPAPQPPTPAAHSPLIPQPAHPAARPARSRQPSARSPPGRPPPGRPPSAWPATWPAAPEPARTRARPERPAGGKPVSGLLDIA
jgi:dienelactone hydrolase